MGIDPRSHRQQHRVLTIIQVFMTHPSEEGKFYSELSSTVEAFQEVPVSLEKDKRKDSENLKFARYVEVFIIIISNNNLE